MAGNIQNNITTRRALTQLDINLANDSDASIDDVLDKSTNSLPSMSADMTEELKNFQHKLDQLNLQLKIAHSEVEKLSLENKSLRKSNQDLLKKNELYKKVGQSPPTTSRRNTKLQQKPKIINKALTESKDELQILEKKDNETQTTIVTLTEKDNIKKNNQQTQTKMPKVKEISTQTDISEDTKAMNRKDVNTQTSHQITIDETKNSLRPTLTKKQKPKMCILSSNRHTKILSAAEKTLDYSTICHYLKSNSNLTELLKGINTKLKDFTSIDFCIIMIGDEDFKTTQDYFSTIKEIRNTLMKVRHTNIIICLPTYKYSKLMNMHNWRVETFNNLLYLDVLTHEHVYLLDSNRNLEYDNTMFDQYYGGINDLGVRVILNDLGNLINDIEELEYSETQETTFFRA